MGTRMPVYPAGPHRPHAVRRRPPRQRHSGNAKPKRRSAGRNAENRCRAKERSPLPQTNSPAPNSRQPKRLAAREARPPWPDSSFRAMQNRQSNVRENCVPRWVWQPTARKAFLPPFLDRRNFGKLRIEQRAVPRNTGLKHRLDCPIHPTIRTTTSSQKPCRLLETNGLGNLERPAQIVQFFSILTAWRQLSSACTHPAPSASAGQPVKARVWRRFSWHSIPVTGATLTWAVLRALSWTSRMVASPLLFEPGGIG